MSTPGRSSHPDDVQLAALLDGECAQNEAAAFREHLLACQDCTSRVEHLRRLTRQLREAPARDVDLVKRITQALDQPPRSTRLLTRWALASSLAAATAAVLFMAWPRAPHDNPSPDSDAEWHTRGGEQFPRSVHFKIYQNGDRTRGIGSGDIIRARTLALAVQIDHLPSRHPRYVALYAREATGKVTWLFPAWTAAEQPPSCSLLSNEAGVLTPSSGVAFDPAPGPIEVGLLVSKTACLVSDLDSRLENGWNPEPGKDSLQEVQQLEIWVDPPKP
jgi:hypothetical protein